jgi:hypothetical protein
LIREGGRKIKEGEAPLLPTFPLPLSKGKGKKGIGFPSKNLRGVRLINDV